MRGRSASSATARWPSSRSTAPPLNLFDQALIDGWRPRSTRSPPTRRAGC